MSTQLSQSVKLNNSIRKFSEDSKLRPFLSTHFDAQSYVKSILTEGKSEECFSEISSHIDDVNEEIKGYISAHHENLMIGMQDVAMLATRYRNLSSSANKIRQNIDRLKQEALDCHDLIRIRSTELERIHQTSIVLRQFRQFVHAKNQLDYYLKSSQTSEGDKDKVISRDNITINGVNFDIRNLANTAAKLVFELEGLIQLPVLCELDLVSSSANSIKRLGEELRHSAQDRLFESLKDRSQASIAACLQIFFHLQSLPQVLLLAIDLVVKTCCDEAVKLLNLDQLVSLHSDLVSQPATTTRSSLISSNISAVNTSVNRPNLKNVGNVVVPFPTSVQIRSSIKDIVAAWANYMYEECLQINVLQRVVNKKEDPNTQQKFSDILKQAISSQDATDPVNVLLANSKLLELFYTRLSASLLDISQSIVKSQPVAASRVYPYLRRAAVDVIRGMKELLVQDKSTTTITSELTSTSYFDQLTSNESKGYSEIDVDEDVGFGSLTWQPFNAFDALGFGSRFKNQNLLTILEESSNDSSKLSVNAANNLNESINEHQEEVDDGLLTGFKPIRDRFLVGSLSRMNFPIHQMFPEMDGYTAAIPSKRDLQTLIKAVQNELVNVVIEGDIGLIRLVCHEGLKTFHLILSKVEDMIINTPDVKKIQLTNVNNVSSFTRNHAQDHNAQLIMLLSQLKEAIIKLPEQVVKAISSSESSNSHNNSNFVISEHVDSVGHSFLSRNNNTTTSSQYLLTSDQLQREIQSIFNSSIRSIDDLQSKQLLAPLLDHVVSYIKGVMLGLAKETTVVSSQSNPGIVGPCESSKAVQTLQKHIPELLSVYFANLPKSPLLVSTFQELALRVMSLYVTIAANAIRPVNEYSRLRTSQDMSVIEDVLINVATIPDANNNKVVQEFKAFRRLLFIEDKSTNSPINTSGTGNSVSSPPNKLQLLSLPYINQLRPSTILGYLISCGPAQLPSPFEASAIGSNIGSNAIAHGTDLGSYIDILSNIHEISNQDSNSGSSNFISIQCLYQVTGWKRSKIEAESWNLIQNSLDIFLQRLSVAEGQQKSAMRAWYELLLELGGYYFDK